MTREEAIERLEWYQCHAETEEDADAFDMAISALRPVSREQVERMRSRWVPLNNTQEHFCESCGVAFNLYAYCRNDYQFCPSCGAPMTDEAVEMVMERMETIR